MKIVLYGILALSIIWWVYQMLTAWKGIIKLRKSTKEFAQSSKEFRDSCDALTDSIKKNKLMKFNQ